MGSGSFVIFVRFPSFLANPCLFSVIRVAERVATTHSEMGISHLCYKPGSTVWISGKNGNHSHVLYF